MQVTCSTCGHPATVTDPAPVDTPDGPQDPGFGWKCNCNADLESDCDCAAANSVDGHPGELGEGALNPAASALSDDDLREAALRRGVIHDIHVGGDAGPTGETA